MKIENECREELLKLEKKTRTKTKANERSKQRKTDDSYISATVGFTIRQLSGYSFAKI